MKKTPLLFLFFAWAVLAAGQDKTITQLKKELEQYPQQDVVRVNKLIDFSFNVFLSFDERKKLSGEVLAISRKINYIPGEAYALSNIGYYKAIEGYLKEGDSIVKKMELAFHKKYWIRSSSHFLLPNQQGRERG